ncbi:MAG TPA: magnesium chelatase [Flavobacteriales bacterium]|jgi:MoxR-like ATPase|nr:magnesium chelatase [Flavobacteriales bacterium]
MEEKENRLNEENTSEEKSTLFDEKMKEELALMATKVDEIKAEVGKVIIGQDHAIKMIVAAMLVRGHILLEGVPGIAKTLLARMIAKTISADFSRIQFTPDLMPSDVLGTNVYNLKTSEFEFKKGPIFSQMILIDEINRAPAKTQSSLFEVMQEKQISLDGITYPMDYPFVVLATQNPIEQEGTYKLPEAQLDRFVFRLRMDYPTPEEELDILKRFDRNRSVDLEKEVKPVISAEELRALRNISDQIHIEENLLGYIAKLVNETRNNLGIFLGASPRASLAIMQTSKALAAIAGRDFVTPDDVREATIPVLNHRIILAPEREMEGFEVNDIIEEIIDNLEIPR